MRHWWQAYYPPLTGGKIAISSPGASIIFSKTYASFTAKWKDASACKRGYCIPSNCLSASVSQLVGTSTSNVRAPQISRAIPKATTFTFIDVFKFITERYAKQVFSREKRKYSRNNLLGGRQYCVVSTKKSTSNFYSKRKS